MSRRRREPKRRQRIQGSRFEAAGDPPARTSTNTRRILFRLLAVVLSILVATAVSEIALRSFGIRPERYPSPRWLAWDGTAYVEKGMWGEGLIKRESRFADQGVQMGEYVPGAQFKVVYATNPRGYFDDDNSITFHINNAGIRGPEVTLEKPVDTHRILGVGDSFTFGVGVRDEDTFLRRLETTLNEGLGEGKTHEVLNVGVQGYNTREEVLYVEHRWLKYTPDLVLIVFYLNDAYSDATFLNNGEGLGIYLQPDGLAQRSYLVDLLQHTWRGQQLRQRMNDYYLQSYFKSAKSFLSNPDETAVDWTVSKAALRHAAELSRQHGFRLAMVVFPELHALDGDYPFRSIHQVVAEAAEAFQIPYLDLLDVYQGHDDRTLWVHPSDHHPNEIAHQLAADALLRFLKSENLLAPGRHR